jgi:hypothetical protein
LGGTGQRADPDPGIKEVNMSLGPFWEGRNDCCYICKFFMQNQVDYRNGICVKHPPQKIDENLGTGVSGAPPGYDIFPNVLDSITGSCGDFELAEVMPGDWDDPPPIYVAPS